MAHTLRLLLGSLLNLLCLLLLASAVQGGYSSRQQRRDYTQLDSEALRRVVNITSVSTSDAILDYHNPDSKLAQILVPRAVGSANLVKVQNLIRDHFAGLSTQASVSLSEFDTWEKYEDTFTTGTPYGPKTFTNLVFTHDPTAERKLVIAAHVDSKFFEGAPQNGFVGATDSAVPCGIMLDIATALTPLLDASLQRASGQSGQRTTLQMIFFDGEEAFQQWTNTDSIYGARHLAELWASPAHTPSPVSPQASSLTQISDFILLDLLGVANPNIPSFFLETGWLYDALVGAESRLGSAGMLWPNVEGEQWSTQGLGNRRRRSFFKARINAQEVYRGRIEDDHLPFLARGVPILHIIPVPFPSVWHTLADDASCLDLPTIQAWSMIFRVLTAEYLGLIPGADDTMPYKSRRTTDELASSEPLDATRRPASADDTPLFRSK